MLKHCPFAVRIGAQKKDELHTEFWLQSPASNMVMTYLSEKCTYLSRSVIELNADMP